ncbi:MAG: Ig-like domain-containing protein [Gemmatimonadales bacterium]|nr:Ig-like domain-containing protein [Gemmatimonadales bacterium]
MSALLAHPPAVARRVVAMVALAFAVGCGGTEPPPAPPPPDVWTVTLGQKTLEAVPGDTVRLVADIKRNGATASTAVTWTSSAPTVAEVDAIGTVVARSPGSATITVSAATATGAVTDQAAVKVDIGIIADATKVIDNVRVLSDTTEIQSGTLRLQQTTASAYPAGTVLLRSTDDQQLLKKVVSASQVGSDVRLQVADASVADAFENLNWESSADLSLAEGVRTSPSGGPVLAPIETPWLAPGVSITAAGDLTLDDVGLSVPIDAGGGKTITTELRIQRGSITFKPRVDAKVRVGFFKLKKFQFTAGGAFGFTADPVTFTLTGTAIKTTTASGSKTLFEKAAFKKARKKLVGARFPGGCAGLVCWTVNLDFNLEVQTTGTITGTVSTGVRSNASVKVGAVFEDGSWSGINQTSGSSSSTAPTITANGEVGLKVTVEPSLSLKLYDVAGPFVAVPATLDASAGVDNWNWFLEAQGSVDAELGGKVEVLDFTLAKLSKTFNLFTSPALRLGGPAASLSLSPASPTINIGGTVQLTPSFVYLGIPWPTPPLSWSSANPSTASVSSGGLVTGVAAGSVEITARLTSNNAILARRTVQVAGPPLQLAVTAPPSTPTVGSTARWRATVTSGSGPVPGATLEVVNSLVSPAVTQTLITDPQGVATFTYTPTLATLTGPRTVTFTASKPGFSPSAPVVTTVNFLFRMRMAVFPPDWQCPGACPANDLTGPYAPSLTVQQWYDVLTGTPQTQPAPGQSRTFLLAVENVDANFGGEPGVAIQILSPFTGTTTTVATGPHPSFAGFPGVALHTFTVPIGTPPGTYSFKFGPATKAGFRPSLQLERKVIVP